MGWAEIYLLIAAIAVIFLNNYCIRLKVDCYFLNIYLDILSVHNRLILVFSVHNCSQLFTIVHNCLTVCSPFVEIVNSRFTVNNRGQK